MLRTSSTGSSIILINAVSKDEISDGNKTRTLKTMFKKSNGAGYLTFGAKKTF